MTVATTAFSKIERQNGECTSSQVFDQLERFSNITNRIFVLHAKLLE